VISSLVLYALIGLVLVVFGTRLGRVAFLVGAVAPALSVVWVAVHLGRVVDGESVSEIASWVPQLNLAVEFRLDALAATMSLIIGVVGVLILVYAASYFPRQTPDVGRLAGLLVLFAGSMAGLVQADNLLLLYVCWELTSVTSYLLIGHRYWDTAARAAALHALLVTAAGGLAMLGGFVILGEAAGTYRLSELARAPAPAGSVVTAAAVLILLGAFTKSAQYPFHGWLPGAMAAPTPVSAYLHSATMVKAGVYLVARLAPLFAATGWWRPVVFGVGLFTMIAGGLQALRQHDLKLLLAHGTVSQLGLMIVLFGAGTPAATTAGWIVLVGHAAFKAALFMVVGLLEHETGTRDIRHLPALSRRWRWVEGAAAISVASMAGIPLTAGFVAKEAAYDAFAAGPFSGAALVLAAVVGGSMLTLAYGARYYLGAFVAPRRPETPAPAETGPAPPPWRFTGPAVVLAAFTLVLGLAPALGERLAATTLSDLGMGDPAEAMHLRLWHGFNVAFGLSALTLAGGALLVVAGGRVQRVLGEGRSQPVADVVYLAALRGLGTLARRVTGTVQSGSLPVYSGVILATAAVLPAGALLGSWEWPAWPGWGPVSDLPIVGVLLAASLGAAIVRRRFSAAVFLGTAGYAMAALFVVHGAPDLALTQAAVETLSTVVFVLVLRWLPEHFERQSTPRRAAVRVGVSGLVGASVFAFAIIAAGAPQTTTTDTPVSHEMVARSVPDGGGRNVVNVILVDFRALDTLGEITVLASAAIGAAALARVDRQTNGAQQTAPTLATAAGRIRRIVFVDVSVQLIFHVVVVTSLWLLFAGHNQPGGGFVGGLLAGSAITLRYIAGGIDEIRRRSRFRPWTVLGAGLLLAATTAAFPVLSGSSVLEVATVSLSLPLVGTAKLSSALVFDIGVYLTVVGVVLMAFAAFGDEPAEARP
jgi:multicomponent Na+:H+ antiporter subunit A